MSFYFKDDGTAAIGKKGIGQIQFNGNKGTIQSGIYELSGGKDGALIDFTTGKIELRNSINGNIELNASDTTIYETEVLDEEKGLIGIVNSKEAGTYLIYQDDKWQVIEYEKDENTNKYTGNYKLKGTIGTPNYKSGFPIKAGKNFKVAWDGSIFAHNGFFTGTINATGGSITGNLAVTGILNGATIKSGNFQVDYETEGEIATNIRPAQLNELENIKYDEKLEDNKTFKYVNSMGQHYESQQALEAAVKENKVCIQYFYGFNMNLGEHGEQFPIRFIAKLKEDTLTYNETAGIGVFESNSSGPMLGIRTGLDYSGNAGQIGIGFDAATVLRAHAQTYSGLSLGNSFNEPQAQACIQNVNGTMEFKIEGITAENVILEVKETDGKFEYCRLSNIIKDIKNLQSAVDSLEAQLNTKASINHSHPEYALKGHTHDNSST